MQYATKAATVSPNKALTGHLKRPLQAMVSEQIRAAQIATDSNDTRSRHCHMNGAPRACHAVYLIWNNHGTRIILVTDFLSLVVQQSCTRHQWLETLSNLSHINRQSYLLEYGMWKETKGFVHRLIGCGCDVVSKRYDDEVMTYGNGGKSCGAAAG